MILLNFAYVPCSRCGVVTAVDNLRYAGKGRYFCLQCDKLIHGGTCCGCREYNCVSAICCLDGKHRDGAEQCKYVAQERCMLINTLIERYVKD